MNQPLVTIAVPIYNEEKYLERCICSLVNQTYRNLEIILVDDLSSDRCPQICDDWAKRDGRIRVIHKEKNEGQGLARNNALAIATGKYICFFDADDYIELNAVDQVVTAAEREETEITVFGLKNISAEGTEVSQIIPQVGEKTYRGNEVQMFFLPEFIAPNPHGKGDALFYMSSCLLMYTTERLRAVGWKYVSERKIISEDVYSVLALFDSVKSVTVVPQALYCYCMNNASFSRKYTPERYAKIKHFYLETVKLCQAKGYNEDILHRISSPYLAYTLGTLKMEAKAPLSLAGRWKIISSIVRDDVLQQVLQQNRYDHMSASRRLVFFLMRNKCVLLSYLLFRMKK